MSDVNKMDFKQLRNEVQLLRDELAIMKRKYEDIIYNLDDSNFSGQFIKEKNDMKTKIEVTAEGIKTKVSKADLENSLSSYSTIEQTHNSIITMVSESYIASQVDDRYTTKRELASKIDQTSEEIYAYVSETRDDLETYISSVSLTAESFETRVSDLEDFKTSTFTQTADGFTLDGEKTTFTGVIYLTDNNNDRKFSIFHDDSQGYEMILLHNTSANTLPIVIGDYDSNVYIGNNADGHQVATRNWVLENGGGSGGTATAVFG